MNIRVIKNRFPGKCAVTKRTVAEGEGYAVKRGNARWQTYCGDLEVLPEWLLNEIKGASASAPTVKRLNADGTITMPYDPNALELLRAMPGSKFDWNTKTRSVSTDPADLPRVLELAEKLGLEVAPELRTAACGTVTGTVDLDTYRSTSGHSPYDYQVDGIDFLTHRRGHGSMIADDMGLGKTAQVLLSLDEDASKVRAIVVAPAAVRFNWRDEVAEWRPDLKVTVLQGRKSFRWPEAGEVVITGYAILPNIGKSAKSGWKVVGADATMQELVDSYPGNVTIAVDEAHRAKNGRTQRSKRLGGLCTLCDTVIGMTGTPLMNRAQDLFGVFASLNLSREVFGSFQTFKRLFNAVEGRYGIEWGAPTPEVAERLRRVMIRRLKTEVLKDLPPKRYQSVVVETSKALLKKLDAFGFSDRIKEYEAAVAAGEEVNVRSYLPGFEEFSKVRSELAMSRLPALLDMVADYEEADEPLVVFSAHKAPMKKVAEREGWGLITGDTAPEERQRLVKLFQSGGLKGLACTIIAAGVGLTMTRAKTVIFLDKDWTPANNAQAEDRVCRIGQQGEYCLYISLVSDHPLDQHVDSLLSDKKTLIESAIETEILFEETPVKASRKGLELSDADRTKLDTELARDREERQNALLERMEAELAKLDREQARERVKTKGWCGRLAARDGAGSPDIEMTEDLRSEVKSAVNYLASVCDGAVEKDGAGFNKPDAGIGRWLSAAGLDDDEIATAAYHLVFKYRNQLGGAENYPTIYG